jgi:hypothetical protein
MLIFSDIQPPGNIACLVINNNIALYHRFYTIIMGGILPSIISFLCSLYIWKYLQDKRKRRLIIVLNNMIERRKRIRDQQVLLMLLIQVVIFIISTIPFMSFNIYDTITRTMTNKSADRKAIEAFLKTFTEFLIYLITLSFYSNTLVSRTFRKELIITCKCQQHRRRIIPMTITQNNTLKMQTIMKITKLSMPEIVHTA